MITISAKRKAGFRRCGVFHSFEPTLYEDNAFTAAQLAVLRAEPMLSVAVLAVTDPKKPSVEK